MDETTGYPEPTRWGTTRRLQALASRGWSPEAIDDATGLAAASVTAAVSGQPGTAPALDARAVAAAYDLLWDQPPPSATPQDRARSAAARAQAQRQAWPPPMAWDDDVIDLPDGRPAPGWNPAIPSLRRSAEIAQDLAWVREHGGYQHASWSAAAARLGLKRGTLQQACRRAARQAHPEAEAG